MYGKFKSQVLTDVLHNFFLQVKLLLKWNAELSNGTSGNRYGEVPRKLEKEIKSFAQFFS